VLHGLEAARTDPAAYAHRLTPQPYVDISDAVGFLSKQAPVPALTYDACLASAAIAQAEDQGPKGGVSHTGSDGSRPSERMRSAGVQTTEYAEVISVGYSTAAGVLEQLIVDQPGPQHPHRDDLFDPSLAVTGVGCGPNARYGTMCVIDLASAYASASRPAPPATTPAQPLTLLDRPGEGRANASLAVPSASDIVANHPASGPPALRRPYAALGR
jgi:hypothetical protein